MLPALPWIIGGLIGAGKAVVGKINENQDRKLAATQWRTSPWTGVKPGKVERSNPLGDIASGVAMGGLWDKVLTSLPVDAAADAAGETIAAAPQVDMDLVGANSTLSPYQLMMSQQNASMMPTEEEMLMKQIWGR